MTTRFLPVPREINSSDQTTTLPDTALIVIADSSLLFEAQTAQQALARFAGLNWPIVAGRDYDNTGLVLEIEEAIQQRQGYQLSIHDGRILIRGADAAGVYYGVCTLSQILQQHQNRPPALQINDWPDFAARGIMLDISRDKVPTMETVLDLVDRLSTWKINQLQLYMEHTFAYQNHEVVWANASPFTGQEIMELDAYCRQRHIELVPNQNSLGHMERWLIHDSYNPLAERPEGFDMPWRKNNPPTSLNPVDPNSIALMSELYSELLPHFTSRKFNVGGDEPWELGSGRSKDEMERIGEGRLYLNYVLKLYEEVSARGKQMMLWDDIIVKYPELVPELPYDLVAMVWGYEADHPFDDRCALFLGSNIPFYVCPGTSSWNTFAGRTDNATGNLRNAAENGLKHGALGFLITDWGDHGHWQANSVSYLGYAYGAAVSWASAANADLDLPPLLDAFVFEDSAGVMGQLVYDLGNLYQIPGHSRPNGHALVDWLRSSGDASTNQHTLINQVRREGETLADLSGRMRQAWYSGFKGLPDEEADALKSAMMDTMMHGFLLADAESLRQAITRAGEIVAPLDNSDMQRPDAGLIKREYRLAADFIRHSARYALFQLGESEAESAELKRELEALIARYRENWLARNRPGGLDDSVARFDKALAAYV